MDFIKRFHFIQKFKDNSNDKHNTTSLGRQKSKRSIFSHHNNDRLVSSNAHHTRYTDSDDDEQDDDCDDYNSNTLIFRQKPLHSITIATTNTNKPRAPDTSKSKSTRPTHQLYNMHHQKNSSSTVKSQLQSLSSSNDVQQHKQLSIAFEGKGTKYTSKHEKQLPEKHLHHKQEKSAMRHPEKTLYQDSTLYAPFIERPEIIEDDYIPLPTVTRKYIDPPPDVLLDSIPSFHHTHKRHHTHLLDNDSTPTSTEVALSPTTTAIEPLQKPKNKLVVSTKQLDDTSIADIGAWLSKNSAALEATNVDIQQSTPKSTTF
ncbi:hypothetical protein V8B55DRAFT_1476831 [Mucor lusitanicus]|uniref:Uncharacterized protein n=1 Tax=Mucor circinelloides f. lusitanicus TaxID=29924 RepID=A0A8H4F328_MUCCL|nr:hypothetical protein FB192DRAFT_1376188 [Mucor lusitanicus]